MFKKLKNNVVEDAAHMPVRVRRGKDGRGRRLENDTIVVDPLHD